MTGQEAPKVSVHIGYTRNLGNYEYLRLDVGIEDGKRSDETIDEAFARVYSKVEKKLVEFVSAAEKQINA